MHVKGTMKIGLFRLVHVENYSNLYDPISVACTVIALPLDFLFKDKLYTASLIGREQVG